MSGQASPVPGPILPAEGDLIAGKYRVEGMIGAGGMGVVLSARHLQLGQRVAIKLLSVPDDARREEASSRFLREAQAAARLRSDHVVRIYDIGMLDTGLPFMVMELLDGLDLGTLIDAEGPQPEHRAADFLFQVCDAMAEAHAAAIIHRDLKPSNLFVTRRSDGSPCVKVLDFGISKSLSAPDSGPSEITLTATRSIMGSPYYMSPEQVRDARKVDARSDIWSLGVILHELLAAEPAFSASTVPGICAAIVADPPTSLRERRPDVSPELEAIVLRCLEKDPSRRFQSVAELASALYPFTSPALLSLGQRAGSSLTGRALTPEVTVASSGRVVHKPGLVDADTLAGPLVETPPPTRGPVGTTRTQLSAGLVSERQTSAVERPPRSRSVLFALGLTLLAGASIAAFTLRKPEQSSAAPSAPAAPPPPAPIFTLSIDTVPPGATVVEGEVRHGETPLDLAVVSGAEPVVRKFVLRKEGYAPHTLEERLGRADRRVHVVLVPEPPAPPPASAESPARAPARAGVERRAAATAPRTSASAKAPPSTPIDIRLQR